MKKLSALATAIFLISSVSAPRRADALIGVGLTAGGIPAAGIPVMVLGGAGVLFGGYVLGSVAYNDTCDNNVLTALVCLFGIGVLGLGVIILDEETGAVRFAELTDEATASLTPEEAEAYSDRLPEINLAAETVAAKLADEMPVGRKLGKKAVKRWLDRSAELWEEQRAVLGDDALAAVGKIAVGAQAD